MRPYQFRSRSWKIYFWTHEFVAGFGRVKRFNSGDPYTDWWIGPFSAQVYDRRTHRRALKSDPRILPFRLFRNRHK